MKWTEEQLSTFIIVFVMFGGVAFFTCLSGNLWLLLLTAYLGVALLWALFVRKGQP